MDDDYTANGVTVCLTYKWISLVKQNYTVSVMMRMPKLSVLELKKKLFDADIENSLSVKRRARQQGTLRQQTAFAMSWLLGIKL